MSNINQHLFDHLGFQATDNYSRNADRLMNRVERDPDRACPALYEAVVGLSANQRLSRLVCKSELDQLASISELAIQKNTVASNTRIYKALSCSAKLYSQFLDRKLSSTDTASLRKSAWAKNGFPDFMPPHSLYRHGNCTIELLTWVGEEEAERFLARYPVFRTATKPFRPFEDSARVYRVFNKIVPAKRTDFGEGSFGVVRLGRVTHLDKYCSIKKLRQKGKGEIVVPSPRIQRALMSKPSYWILRIHAWGPKNSARRSDGKLSRPGYICAMELGLTNLKRPIQGLSVLRWIFQNNKGPLEKARIDILRKLAATKAYRLKRPPLTAENDMGAVKDLLEGVKDFANASTRYRYTVEWAFEVVAAINDFMYGVGDGGAHGRHQDVKPENMIFLESQGAMCVKLTDLDFAISDLRTGGPNPECRYRYGTEYYRKKTAQLSLEKDLFGAGMTIRQIAGEHLDELVFSYDRDTRKLVAPESYHMKPAEYGSIEGLLAEQEGVDAFIHPIQIGKLHTAMRPYKGTNTFGDFSLGFQRLFVRTDFTLKNPVFQSQRRMETDRFREMTLALIEFSQLLDDSVLNSFIASAAKEHRVRAMNYWVHRPIRQREHDFLKQHRVTTMSKDELNSFEKSLNWSVAEMLDEPVSVGTSTDSHPLSPSTLGEGSDASVHRSPSGANLLPGASDKA
ncbi:MAG TPA: hypothetical protein VGE55_04460 [Limnobacter sp.]|uniref:hypothetical protein n=1 Tax=Limnobacter sp. TaxID=2003368 RepID=UPI002ED7A940